MDKDKVLIALAFKRENGRIVIHSKLYGLSTMEFATCVFMLEDLLNSFKKQITGRLKNEDIEVDEKED